MVTPGQGDGRISDKASEKEQRIDDGGKGVQNKALHELAQSPGAKVNDATAFQDKTSAKSDKQQESPTAVLNNAVKALTGLDFRTADQNKLTEAINRDMPKALEAVKALAGGSKIDAVTKFATLHNDAVKGTSQRIDTVTQRIEDLKGVMPAAEEQQRKARLSQRTS